VGEPCGDPAEGSARASVRSSRWLDAGKPRWASSVGSASPWARLRGHDLEQVRGSRAGRVPRLVSPELRFPARHIRSDSRLAALRGARSPWRRCCGVRCPRSGPRDRVRGLRRPRRSGDRRRNYDAVVRCGRLRISRCDTALPPAVRFASSANGMARGEAAALVALVPRKRSERRGARSRIRHGLRRRAVTERIRRLSLMRRARAALDETTVEPVGHRAGQRPRARHAAERCRRRARGSRRLLGDFLPRAVGRRTPWTAVSGTPSARARSSRRCGPDAMNRPGLPADVGVRRRGRSSPASAHDRRERDGGDVP